jgi:hypothetical protein
MADEPLLALIRALDEVQIASSLLLDAVKYQALGNIVIAANDAHSWWQVARANFSRAAVRARVATTMADAVQLADAKFALDHTHATLNSRLVAAIITIDHPAVRHELQALQQSLALAEQPNEYQDG